MPLSSLQIYNYFNILFFSSGKSSLMNMELSQQVTIMEHLNCNQSAFRYIITKHQAANMSQELSFSIWSLAPWIPSVLDHMVEFSAQTIMFLVKAEPEITGLRDIIQKVNYTEGYKKGTLYKGSQNFHQVSHFIDIQ